MSFFERTGQVNKYTLDEIAQALNITVSEIESIDIVPAVKHRKKDKTVIPSSINLLEQLKEENIFLKKTIESQFQIIAELSKKVKKDN